MKNVNDSLKHTVKQLKDELCYEFCQKGSISALTRKLVAVIDEVLCGLFIKNQLHLDTKFCLLALGSYGRRELQLYSDIDLLMWCLMSTIKLSLIPLSAVEEHELDA